MQIALNLSLHEITNILSHECVNIAKQDIMQILVFEKGVGNALP
jgi:hypothetical protein